MAPRTWLVLMVVAATASFAVGVGIERGNEAGHHEARGEVHAGSGEGAEGGAGETGHVEGSTTETHEELRPLGIDIEAWPFVVAAAVGSLGLAAAAWLRPQQRLLLLLVAVAMLAFAVLDIREVFHQADIAESGLAVLAGVVAALHVAAAGVAGLIGGRGG